MKTKTPEISEGGIVGDEPLAQEALNQLRDVTKRLNGNLERMWEAITTASENNKKEHDKIIDQSRDGTVDSRTALLLGALTTISAALAVYIITGG